MIGRLQDLLRKADIPVNEVRSVHGGDINDSFRISAKDGRDLFAKINRPGSPKSIITAEAKGLEFLRSHAIKNIISEFQLIENENNACLILPFFERISPSNGDWKVFFRELAIMHVISAEYFGGEDNFIGALPQKNTPRNNWITFYRDGRIQPQLDMAMQQGYFTEKDRRSWSRMFENIAAICPIERPALIHGDLWSGNILPTRQGILMIDACPHFSHREMDLGMMSLFSGFPIHEYISEYVSVYPLESGWQDRLDLYQLYYLLVHLNMFGTSYLPGVQRILRRFL